MVASRTSFRPNPRQRLSRAIAASLCRGALGEFARHTAPWLQRFHDFTKQSRRAINEPGIKLHELCAGFKFLLR